MSWENKDWDRANREERPPGGPVMLPLADPSLILALQEYLEKRSLSYTVADRCGWYPAWAHGPRIITPCTRDDGPTFWQGRLLDNVPHQGSAKRWDSPHGPRGDALCYLPAHGSRTMVVVEGPMDALAATMAGVSAIATLGIGAPGPVLAHAANIIRSGFYNQVIIIPDRDEVGAWVRIQKDLGTMGVIAEIREPWAKDLADMIPANREELIRG